MFEIVAGIDDDGEIVRRKNMRQAEGELCAADTAGQGENVRAAGRHRN